MNQSPNNGAGYSGQQRPADQASDFDAITFLVRRLLGRMATCTLVQVQAVTNNGGVSAVGMVDILPLVNQLDGAGNAVPHSTIFGCPYHRLQGGTNAIILDPVAGDIGIAVFGSRDLSAVIANKGQANPGSYRMNDMADALYIGGVLNGVPVNYLRYSVDGVELHSETRLKFSADTIELEYNHLKFNGSVDFRTPGNVIAGDGTGDQVGLQTHRHGAGPAPDPGT